MFGEMLDTSSAQQEVYFARLRSLSLEERANMLARLCRGVRSLATAGIRQKHPEFTADQVRRELASRLYGEVVATRLFGAATP